MTFIEDIERLKKEIDNACVARIPALLNTVEATIERDAKKRTLMRYGSFYIAKPIITAKLLKGIAKKVDSNRLLVESVAKKVIAKQRIELDEKIMSKMVGSPVASKMLSGHIFLPTKPNGKTTGQMNSSRRCLVVTEEQYEKNKDKFTIVDTVEQWDKGFL
jgi:hypothetical protein